MPRQHARVTGESDKDIGRHVQRRLEWQVDERIIELGKRFGFDVDPDAKVGDLSVGWQQRVEILKALYREARILIMDEPTAVLTPQEAVSLFSTLRTMADEGKTVIFISHKLHEVKAVADRVTVLLAQHPPDDLLDRHPVPPATVGLLCRTLKKSDDHERRGGRTYIRSDRTPPTPSLGT